MNVPSSPTLDKLLLLGKVATLFERDEIGFRTPSSETPGLIVRVKEFLEDDRSVILFVTDPQSRGSRDVKLQLSNQRQITVFNRRVTLIGIEDLKGGPAVTFRVD